MVWGSVMEIHKVNDKGGPAFASGEGQAAGKQN